MTDVIKTERLVLRRFRESDIGVVTSALQDIEMVRMIPSMPWPYTEHDAVTFVRDTAQNDPSVFAIERDGDLHGAVGVNGQLGYWIARNFWGNGFATEASHAVLKRRFRLDKSHVKSSHRVENTRSRQVLTKLGFQDTAVSERFCNAEASTVVMQDMELTHTSWQAFQ